MAMKISEIPPEGLTLELAQKLDLFDTGTASTAVTAVLGIKPTGAGILHITGRVQADPVFECSRCLKDFSYRIDTELNIDLAPAKVLGMSPEHELGRSELDMEFYRGKEIEPLDFVKEQVLISVPMVPLHCPDCKGLCPVCGTDLNEADCSCQKNSPGEFGAFSALKDLLKKVTTQVQKKMIRKNGELLRSEKETNNIRKKVFFSMFSKFRPLSPEGL